jgi:hypothetical protein
MERRAELVSEAALQGGRSREDAVRAAEALTFAMFGGMTSTSAALDELGSAPRLVAVRDKLADA